MIIKDKMCSLNSKTTKLKTFGALNFFPPCIPLALDARVNRFRQNFECRQLWDHLRSRREEKNQKMVLKHVLSDIITFFGPWPNLKNPLSCATLPHRLKTGLKCFRNFKMTPAAQISHWKHIPKEHCNCEPLELRKIIWSLHLTLLLSEATWISLIINQLPSFVVESLENIGHSREILKAIRWGSESK